MMVSVQDRAPQARQAATPGAQPPPTHTASRDDVTVSEATPDRARDMVSVILEAFSRRPVLAPPAPALLEDEESVAAGIRAGGGLVADIDGHALGALLLQEAGTARGPSLELRRVSVRPAARHLGVARSLVRAAEDVARSRGLARVHLTAREELPATVRFWLRLGYCEVERSGSVLTMARELPVEREAEQAEQTRDLGRRLSARLRAGDLVLLTGDLGAGKTTFAQGLGAGLGVRGQVTSPTFVLSRVHPSESGGPALVHVDAYRLGGVAELDDLDLDVSLDDSVTVVEWGGGVAEGLAEDRLEVEIARSASEGEERRTLRLTPIGPRWVGSDLAAL